MSWPHSDSRDHKPSDSQCKQQEWKSTQLILDSDHVDQARDTENNDEDREHCVYHELPASVLGRVVRVHLCSLVEHHTREPAPRRLSIRKKLTRRAVRSIGTLCVGRTAAQAFLVRQLDRGERIAGRGSLLSRLVSVYVTEKNSS